jgi:TonB-linked SusC/RagA family outer membrane protein
MLLFSLQLQAQRLQVSGSIMDEWGETVIGASISVKNTSYGTVSDMNGKFSLDCSPNDILTVRYIGYATLEVPARSVQQSLVLKEDVAHLDEVVVVGYGSIEKRRLTNAVASIKPDNFVGGSVKSIGQSLQGKVAGLAISTTSGDPTSGVDILLRGTNTLNGNNIPLILVDGIPGNLEMLAPEDIASIDILKDGSSAAIYGTRATNGVILITTKKGQTDLTEVEYSTYASTESFFNKPKVMTAQEWRENRATGDHVNLNWGDDTKWLDAIQRENTPATHFHSVSLRGGNKNTNYLASINYRNSEGIFRNSDAQRTNIRANINHSMFNNKLIFNLNYLTNYFNYTTTTDGDGSFNSGAYSTAIRSNPTAPVRVTNPETGQSTWMEPFPDFGVGEGVTVNPVALLEEGIGKNKRQQSNIYGTISLFPISGLKLETLLSYQRYNMTRGYATTFEHPSVANYPSAKKGFTSRASTETEERMMELTAQYSKDFLGKHSLSVLGGYSYIDRYWEHFWMNNSDFPTDQFTYNNIGIGKDLAEGKAGMYSSKNSGNLIGFFGRLNYSFADRYLLAASLRYEGDSKFVGSDQEWGLFPAVSAAWRIKQENFMQDVSFIDDLKLRAGFGVTGIAPSQYYQAYYRLGYTGNSQSFYYNGQWINMLEPHGNRNPEFTWEKKNEYNIGLDFSFFKNRLGGTVDLYKRKTKDLLYNYGVPVPPNVYSTMLKNVGTISNRGLEALFTVVPVKTKDFRWQAAFTFSTNTNKLETFYTDYTESVDYMEFRPFSGEINPQISHRVQVGEPIGQFYTFKYLGVDNTGKWIIEIPDKVFDPNNPETYAVYSGEGSIPAEYRQYVGNALPKFYAGFNNNFFWKGIDLGITMRGAFGHQILNYQRAMIGVADPGKIGFNILAAAYDKQPVVVGEEIGASVVPQNNITMNSFFVEDADFWKIDNITLGYTFNTSKIKWLKNIRIYVSVLNAFCFTSYSGTDPEVGTGGLTPGIDWADKYPTTRVYTIGLNVKF